MENILLEVTQLSGRFFSFSDYRKIPIPRLPIGKNFESLAVCRRPVTCGSGQKLWKNFGSRNHWMLEDLNFQQPKRKHVQQNTVRVLRAQDRDQSHCQNAAYHKNQDREQLSSRTLSNELSASYPHHEGKSMSSFPFGKSMRIGTSAKVSPAQQTKAYGLDFQSKPASVYIVVIGATGELSRRKIFPALFALYYTGFLPEDFGIFGYSRKNLTDDDLRSMIESTLTCRVDQQQNCEDKMEAFLKRTYYLNAGYDNRVGMSKLNTLMEQVEGESGGNRIFYLSVPQDALLDVASSLADRAQTQMGWNRIIIEKPFGSDSKSSYRLTQALLSKFEEQQLYRIDHLLGRNTIENLTVLRFSNLVFMPLWNRNYIRNVQVILSEDSGIQTPAGYLNSYGVIGDIVHSHIFQTIALLAMEPPASLAGEDVRSEKVKLLRSIRNVETSDVILGCCSRAYGSGDGAMLGKSVPTYFAAALHIDNARWDGVPFLIRVGRGLGKHRVEIRIQFDHVPGNLYHTHIGRNTDLSNNELILRDFPDEAILVRVNNKIPGLGIRLDASELNLLYKDKYDIEVPDSYEQLLHDVMDGDNHLFMRSDEVAAAWNILSPVLHELDKNNLPMERYELGGRGPENAVYLWAKHGVQWFDD